MAAPTDTWTATANDAWLHLSVANQSGTGSTNVVFSYDANPGATRTGTLTIAGQTLTVTQAGSTYVAAPGPVTTLVASGLSNPLRRGGGWRGQCLFRRLRQQRDQEVDGGEQHRHHPGRLGIEPVPWRGGGWRGQCLYCRLLCNNAIKKWTAASNTVTTLVGSGLNRSPGAWRWMARAMSISADYGPQCDQEVDGGEQHRHHAGRFGVEPALGVAVDGAGNVYIADTRQQRDQEWTAANNTVTTLVASGLNQPWWRGGGWRGQCLYRRHRQQRDQEVDGGEQHRHHAGLLGIELSLGRGGGWRGQCLYRRHRQQRDQGTASCLRGPDGQIGRSGRRQRCVAGGAARHGQSARPVRADQRPARG